MSMLLNVTSTNGHVTQMQISSLPDLSDAHWVAYESSVLLPISDVIYLRFADETGVISSIITDTRMSPNQDPLSDESPYTLFLPWVTSA